MSVNIGTRRRRRTVTRWQVDNETMLTKKRKRSNKTKKGRRQLRITFNHGQITWWKEKEDDDDDEVEDGNDDDDDRSNDGDGDD
jgi:hypothetical protein